MNERIYVLWERCGPEGVWTEVMRGRLKEAHEWADASWEDAMQGLKWRDPAWTDKLPFAQAVRVITRRPSPAYRGDRRIDTLPEPASEMATDSLASEPADELATELVTAGT